MKLPLIPGRPPAPDKELQRRIAKLNSEGADLKAVLAEISRWEKEAIQKIIEAEKKIRRVKIRFG